MKKFAWALASFSLLLLSIWIFTAFFNQQDPVTYDTPRQVRFGLTVQNTTNQFVEDAVLWVYAPVKNTSSQICNTIETSHPYELTTDCFGNQILRFSLTGIAPYASAIIKIKSDLALSSKTNAIDLPPDLSVFLAPEQYVESGHSQLTDLAASLKKTNPEDTAESIFNWVADHIEYSGYLHRERGALYAYRQGKGDCTEYMDLFAALCRAADIPCKRVGGYICEKNKVLAASDYHNWAEFLSDGKWYVADPMNRVFMEKAADYIDMHIIGSGCPNEMKDRNRFRLEGEGLIAKFN